MFPQFMFEHLVPSRGRSLERLWEHWEVEARSSECIVLCCFLSLSLSASCWPSCAQPLPYTPITKNHAAPPYPLQSDGLKSEAQIKLPFFKLFLGGILLWWCDRNWYFLHLHFCRYWLQFWNQKKSLKERPCDYFPIISVNSLLPLCDFQLSAWDCPMRAILKGSWY